VTRRGLPGISSLRSASDRYKFVVGFTRRTTTARLGVGDGQL
jgi:ATP-dependent phosphoenolpyruvate carboxykinase